MDIKVIARQAWHAATTHSMGEAANSLEVEFRRAAFEKWWEEEMKGKQDERIDIYDTNDVVRPCVA